jgi:hypothetical protein
MVTTTPRLLWSRLLRFRRLRLALFLALFLSPAFSVRAAEPAVAVLYGAAWSPDDAARDGAAEFEVLLCAARLRQTSPLAGIVGVGRRHAAFSPAAEIALQRVAHMGFPVVRLAGSGPLPAHQGDVFIEAGLLPVAEAQRLLAQCLVRYGALPAAQNPARPTKKESAALQAKLALYQLQFDSHNAILLAMR